MAYDKQNWKVFYQLAAELLESEPWLHFDDGQLFCIKYLETEEPVYVNILGNAGNTYGLVFYEGEDGLNDYNLLRTGGDLNLPPVYPLFQQNCLTIYFGEEEEMPDEQYEIFMESGFDFSDSVLGIPYVLSLRRGFYPWTPENVEIAKLNAWLRMFLDVLPYGLPSENWGFGMDHGCCYCDITAEDEDDWTFDYPPLPSIDYTAELATFSDEQIRDQIRNARRNDMIFEMDVHYTNMHISDPAWPRPCAAPFVLAADTATGMIIGEKLAEPDEDISLVMNEILLNTVSDYGIPREIRVRSVLFADMIESAADLMKTTVNICDSLKAIDEAVEFLESGMTGMHNEMLS